MIFQNLNYMSSLITTNSAICTREIKTRIAIANVVFNKKKDSFHQQDGSIFKAVKVNYNFACCFVWV
jgi:hypothetical protein